MRGFAEHLTGMLSDMDFAENHSAERKTDFYSAARTFFQFFAFAKSRNLFSDQLYE